MRWSEQDLADYLKRHGVAGRAAPVDVSDPPFKLPPDRPEMTAKGRLRPAGMNGLEREYDAYLWLLRHSGEVLWHKYEGIKLRLAEKCFLTVDFAVLPKSGVIELHETKGGWFRDDAKVKLRVAASLYPFRFVLIRKAKDGAWKTEDF